MLHLRTELAIGCNQTQSYAIRRNQAQFDAIVAPSCAKSLHQAHYQADRLIRAHLQAERDDVRAGHHKTMLGVRRVREPLAVIVICVPRPSIIECDVIALDGNVHVCTRALARGLVRRVVSECA